MKLCHWQIVLALLFSTNKYKYNFLNESFLAELNHSIVIAQICLLAQTI